MPRYDLKVPYKEKDEAKRFGAKWDVRRKIWYFEGEQLPHELEFWYPGGMVAETPVTGVRMEAAVISGEQKDMEDMLMLPGEFEREHAVSRIPNLEQYKTVSEVNEMIAEIYRDTPNFHQIMVKGEVTNFDGYKGKHYFFSLKEEIGQKAHKEVVLLPCCMWEYVADSVLTFELQAGQQVAVIGELQFYEATGRTSLIVKQIYNIGKGMANLAFLQLKEKLQSEGLFDVRYKKTIPKHPEKVGIVTSKDGQAIKDICKVAGKRNPYVQLILYHVKVQGKDAVETIIEGIQKLDQLGLDSIIVGRGGGSEEELMVYNDEKLVRTVFSAKTPIISAVGHQGHFTLIDYVADKRVATPSEAAEEAIPDIMRDIQRVQELRESIQNYMRHALERRKLLLGAKRENSLNYMIRILEKRHFLLDAQTKSLEKNHPEQLIKNRTERLDRLSERMKGNIMQALEKRNHRFEVALTKLHGLSPTAKLVKGFGYITYENKPLTSASMITSGDQVQIKIHDGDIRAQVTEVAFIHLEK